MKATITFETEDEFDEFIEWREEGLIRDDERVAKLRAHYEDLLEKAEAEIEEHKRARLDATEALQEARRDLLKANEMLGLKPVDRLPETKSEGKNKLLYVDDVFTEMIEGMARAMNPLPKTVWVAISETHCGRDWRCFVTKEDAAKWLENHSGYQTELMAAQLVPPSTEK